MRLVAGLAVFFGLSFAGYFGFVQLQEQARIAPDIPFEELTGETQTQITRYLNDGKGLEAFSDYAGALAQYRSAYELHPRNADATAAMVALMEKLTVLVLQNEDTASRSRVLQNLENLMETDGFLSTHETLEGLREQLENNG